MTFFRTKGEMDLNEICRTCLSSGRIMFPLFGVKMIRNDTGSVSVINVLKIFTNIAINSNDNFPKKMCTSCLEIVNCAYGFTLKCRSSENILKPLIEGNISFNHDEICRTCLHADGPMFSLLDFLFHKNDSIYETIPIYKILKLFLEIITPNAKAPDKICTSCLEEVKCTFAFKLKCENSDKLLKRTFKYLSLPSNNNSSNKAVPNNVDFNSVSVIKMFEDDDTNNFKSPSYDIGAKPNMSQCIAFESIIIKNEYEMEVDDVNSNLKRTDNILECGSEELNNLTIDIDDSEQLSEALLNLVNASINQDINKPAKYQCNKIKTEIAGNEYTENCRRHPIQCPGCCILIPSIALLANHMKNNHTNERTCMLCNKERINWPEHVSVHICDICFKTFHHKSAVSKHKKIHRLGENKCKTRVKNCRSKDHLAKHMHRNHTERPHKCTLCSYSTFDENHLASHWENIHLSCEYCSSKFENLEELRKHFEHTGKCPYQCDVCSFISNSRRHLIEHKKEHEFEHTGRCSYHCNECSFICDSRSHLIEHKRLHCDDIIYCEICNEKFNSKKNIRAHMKIHVLKNKKGAHTIICEICNEKFTSELNIRVHMKMHIINNKTVASNYKCDACSQIFWVKTDANKHKKTHIVLRSPTNIRFKCKLCRSTFKRQRYLIHHMKTHRFPIEHINEKQ